MLIRIQNIMPNHEIYAIRHKYGVNNKHELYQRTQIIYGKFVDNDCFQYDVVYNGRIQYDGSIKYCRTSDLLKHNGNIYMFEKYEEAKYINDIVKAEFLKVPMKYTDTASINEILKKLGKLEQNAKS